MNQQRLKRAVQRGARKFAPGLVKAVGFGVVLVSGIARVVVDRADDHLRIGERVQRLSLEHMADQYEKDPSSLKGEYLAMAMVYSSARKAKREIEEEEDRTRQARKDTYIEDALAETLRRRAAKKK